jgi:uncharacterized protein YecA (UPF0149 family)
VQASSDDTSVRLEAANEQIEELGAAIDKTEEQGEALQLQIDTANEQAHEMELTAPHVRPRALRTPVRKLIDGLKTFAEAEVRAVLSCSRAPVPLL